MRYIVFLLSGLLACANSFVLAEDVPVTVKIDMLSEDIVNKMVVAAVKDCSKRGYKVSVSVVGRDGNLLAFLRNPLAGAHTIKVSQMKAFTSASFQVSTASLTSNEELKYAPDVLLIVGGLPISIGGKFYGGIAVSGADPKIDEKCALSGIEAIEEIVDFAE
jgi:uncharacterized protein GlcG (DUF336 family)